MAKKPKIDAAAATWEATESLMEWQANPRVNDEAVDLVADSITRFGFGSPIVVRRANREIIAGHTRFKAARKLGLIKVPVVFADLDPVEAQLLALADNRVAEDSEWNTEELGELLNTLNDEDAIVAGFSDSEIEHYRAAHLATDEAFADEIGTGTEDYSEAGEVIRPMTFLLDPEDFDVIAAGLERLQSKKELHNAADAVLWLLQQHHEAAPE